MAKQLEIKRIIKTEQNNELTKNLSVFLNLNNEERILRQELVDKQHELQAKEKQLKIANVVHQTRVRNLKREEREKFIGSFIQAKNLIEKQMKIGNHIRDKKARKDANKKKVMTLKSNKVDDQMALPITTKQIDGSMLIDAEMSTHQSSNGDFYSADPDSGAKPGFQIKRGRSQQMSAKSHMQGQAGLMGDRAVRNSGQIQSANKRRDSAQKRTNRVSAIVPTGKPPSNYSQMFPPLNETSFSE